jgi:hypothetical protein
VIEFPLWQIAHKIRINQLVTAKKLRVRFAEAWPLDPTPIAAWTADWLWALPLIATTVVIHSFGLGLIDQRVTALLKAGGARRVPQWLSMLVVGGTALCATVLHGFEGMIWAAAYILVGALPDRKSAMLYSLNAMTTYGHANLHLGAHWQLMGSLEALNGWILFGLTTALLFTVVQKVWPHMNHHSS